LIKFSNKITASIIIPVFNDIEGLDTTLNSISTILGNREDVEVIICNDGGGNHTSKIIKKYNFREAILSKNRGSYAARNKGIQIADGTNIIFLDADQEITETWLDSGLFSLKEYDYTGGKVVIELGENPSIWELLDSISAFPVKEYLKKMHFAPTANLFVAKYVFDDLGLFNENLRSCGDFEFGNRIFNAGYKQGYDPEAITVHPARNKSQQFSKMKRVGTGLAELHCIIWKKNTILFFLNSARKLIQIPLELSYQSLIYLFSKKRKETLFLKFIIMKKILKMIQLWYIVHRTFLFIISKK
jgi:glycosyltransferase AglI